MWGLPEFYLEGRHVTELFSINDSFRKEIMKLGIETDLGDEHFLILRAAGYSGSKGASEFKRQTMESIVSCNYGYIKSIYSAVNDRSAYLARKSLQALKS